MLGCGILGGPRKEYVAAGVKGSALVGRGVGEFGMWGFRASASRKGKKT